MFVQIEININIMDSAVYSIIVFTFECIWYFNKSSYSLSEYSNIYLIKTMYE